MLLLSPLLVHLLVHLMIRHIICRLLQTECSILYSIRYSILFANLNQITWSHNVRLCFASTNYHILLDFNRIVPSFLSPCFGVVWKIGQLNKNMFLSSHIVELDKFLSFNMMLSVRKCATQKEEKRREWQTTYLLSLPHKKWSKLKFYVWILPINLTNAAKMCWTNYQHVSQHHNRIIRFRNEFSHSKNAIDLKISANGNF